MATPIVTKDEFFSKVSFATGARCWIWRGARNNKGYGIVFPAKGPGWGPLAHRLSWAFANGDPGELHVLHRCDTPACVRPDHLFLGTNRDNVVDRDTKGRGPRGSANGKAILNEAAVRAIRSLPNVKGRTLARRYGVSEQTVCNIRRRRTWRHLD